MNTEKQINKILMNLNPNAKRCRRCRRIYDKSMVFPLLGVSRYCILCCLNVKDRHFNQKILDNGGKEFLEKVFFHQYNIEIINSDPQNLTCTVAMTLE